MTHDYYDHWIYICRTCGKERPRLNADNDCSSCSQIHDAVPSPPNAECGYCHNLVHLLNNSDDYWCYDCNTQYPRTDAQPIP